MSPDKRSEQKNRLSAINLKSFEICGTFWLNLSYVFLSDLLSIKLSLIRAMLLL